MVRHKSSKLKKHNEKSRNLLVERQLQKARGVRTHYSSLHLTLDSAIARPREGRERAARGPREGRERAAGGPRKGREMSKLHPRDPAVEKNHQQVRQVQYTLP